MPPTSIEETIEDFDLVFVDHSEVGDSINFPAEPIKNFLRKAVQRGIEEGKREGEAGKGQAVREAYINGYRDSGAIKK